MVTDTLDEQLRTIVLEPGEYALLEFPDGISQEHADVIKALLPEDLRGRVLLVAGKVHTLKPSEEPTR